MVPTRVSAPASVWRLVAETWIRSGWRFAELAGWIVMLVGLLALGAASSVALLGYEQLYLGQSVDALAAHHGDRVVDFMVHNRVAFGGALLVTGWLYVWLAHFPLRRGEPWAWWTLLLSATLGAGSFFSYVTGGYFDSWHALGSLGITLVLGFGLACAYPALAGPRGPLSLLPPRRPLRRLLRRERATLGWLLLSAWALGTIGGGALVLATGMFEVFVPEDLIFMNTTAAALAGINARLVPFIAHDRSGFGGALVASGIALFGCVWHGLRPGAQRLVPWLAAAWAIAVLTALGVHLLIGYNSARHLLPFLLVDAAFPAGLALYAWPRRAERPPAEG